MTRRGNHLRLVPKPADTVADAAHRDPRLLEGEQRDLKSTLNRLCGAAARTHVIPPPSFLPQYDQEEYLHEVEAFKAHGPASRGYLTGFAVIIEIESSKADRERRPIVQQVTKAYLTYVLKYLREHGLLAPEDDERDDVGG